MAQLTDMQADIEKLKEILLYLSYLSGKTPEKLGKTKIIKILWFFEGIIYLATGKRSIGGKFVKHNYGPYLVELDEAIRQLEIENRITVRPKVYDEFNPKYVWLFKTAELPKLSKLSEFEVVLLSKLYEEFSKFPAKRLSKLTHDHYYLAKDYGEEMTPLAILLYFEAREPSESAREWAEREWKAIEEGREWTPWTEELLALHSYRE